MTCLECYRNNVVYYNRNTVRCSATCLNHHQYDQSTISYKQIILPAPKQNIKHQHHLQPACWCLIFGLNLNFQSPTKKERKKSPNFPQQPQQASQASEQMINGMRRRSNIKTPRPAELCFVRGATNPPEKLNMELGHHVPPSVDGNLQGHFLRSSPVFPMFTCDFDALFFLVCREMLPISRQEGYLGKTDRSPGLKVYITISESHEQKEQPPNLQGLLFGYKEG